MPEFVTVVVEATGRKQRVPAHYLDHPVLSRGLRRPPSEAEVEKLAGPPDDTWTIPQLTNHAKDHGIDLAGATRKPDILAAIDAATGAADPTSPGGTEPPAETPPAGD